MRIFIEKEPIRYGQQNDYKSYGNKAREDSIHSPKFKNLHDHPKSFPKSKRNAAIARKRFQSNKKPTNPSKKDDKEEQRPTIPKMRRPLNFSSLVQKKRTRMKNMENSSSQIYDFK